MDRISRMLQNAGPQGGNMAAPTSDAPQVDTAEQISISSLALLKMLKHGASWLIIMFSYHRRDVLAFNYLRTVSAFHVTPHRSQIMPLVLQLQFCRQGVHPDWCSVRLRKWRVPYRQAHLSHILSCAGRAGVPMEVMGLMLGEFVDDYTVKVVDVFAMPQSGTGVSVEAVDPVFQTKMLDMLKQCGRRAALLTASDLCRPLPLCGLGLHRDGYRKAFVLCIISGRCLKGCNMCCRPEMVVGWYHSHPGFGCWLSGVDINTQQVWLILRMLTRPNQVDGSCSGHATRFATGCLQENDSSVLQSLRLQGVLPCAAA